MIIRSYRDADLAAIAELFTASVHSLAVGHYDAVQRAAWAPQPPDLEHFFERQGFRIVEEQNVEVRGAWFRRYAMRKPVSVAG